MEPMVSFVSTLAPQLFDTHAHTLRLSQLNERMRMGLSGWNESQTNTLPVNATPDTIAAGLKYIRDGETDSLNFSMELVRFADYFAIEPLFNTLVSEKLAKVDVEVFYEYAGEIIRMMDQRPTKAMGFVHLVISRNCIGAIAHWNTIAVDRCMMEALVQLDAQDAEARLRLRAERRLQSEREQERARLIEVRRAFSMLNVMPKPRRFPMSTFAARDNMRMFGDDADRWSVSETRDWVRFWYMRMAPAELSNIQVVIRWNRRMFRHPARLLDFDQIELSLSYCRCLPRTCIRKVLEAAVEGLAAKVRDSVPGIVHTSRLTGEARLPRATISSGHLFECARCGDTNEQGCSNTHLAQMCVVCGTGVVTQVDNLNHIANMEYGPSVEFGAE